MLVSTLTGRAMAAETEAASFVLTLSALHHYNGGEFRLDPATLKVLVPGNWFADLLWEPTRRHSFFGTSASHPISAPLRRLLTALVLERHTNT
jgi:hypothetical protein